MLPNKPAAVLFDLDGTLVDSVPDIAWATDRMLETLLLPVAGEERVRTWVGNGAPRLVERALRFGRGEDPFAETPVEAFAGAMETFLRFYRESNGRHSRLFAGVETALQRLSLHRIPAAVVTNKPVEFVPHLLEQLGIAHHFALWLGGDSVPQRKPAPDMLLSACERLAVPVADALMVGDSRNDIQAARAAGMQVLAVTYGYNRGRPVTEDQPDFVLDNLSAMIWPEAENPGR